MSLTGDLRALAAQCRAAAPHPAHLSPRDGHREGWLDVLAANLDSIAERVALIEHAPAPSAAATGNVVYLHRRRTDRGGRVA